MKTRRYVAFFMALVILSLNMPWEAGAYGASMEEAKVREVSVTRNYSSPKKVASMNIRVGGSGLEGLGPNPVIAEDQEGNPIDLSPTSQNNWNIFYNIEESREIYALNIADRRYVVRSGVMPIINELDPANRLVSVADGRPATIKILGERFSNIETQDNQDRPIRASLTRNSGEIGGLKLESDSVLSREFTAGENPGGSYDLRLEEERLEADVTYSLVHSYSDLFRVHEALNVSDDIYLVPTIGPAGSEVSIIGKLLRSGDLSVFFTKKEDGSHDFSREGLGEIISYDSNVDIEGQPKDILRVRLPQGLDQGEYYVVLTNRVDPEAGEDFGQNIVSLKELEDRFTVISADSAAFISDLDPGRGPESGLEARVYGRNLGSISSTIFTPSEGLEISSNLEDVTNPQGLDQMTLSYGPREGDGPIGTYNFLGSGAEVYRIERELKGYIGNPVGFLRPPRLASQGDNFDIRIRSIDLEEDEDREREVTFQIQTSYYGRDDQGQEILLRHTDELAKWKDLFYYEKTDYRPEISQVIPELIPVDENRETRPGLKLTIIGKNFLKHSFQNPAGEIIVKMPVIDLGGQGIFDPNISQDQEVDGIIRHALGQEDMKIYNGQGQELDGKEGNNLGEKLVLRLPGVQVSENLIDSPLALKLYNHSKDDQEVDETRPDDSLANLPPASYDIRFVRPRGESPLITSLEPRLVTLEGHREAEILGSNFEKDLKIYLEGDEIRGFKRDERGTRLVFDLPARLEGTYQILVQNPDGGLDTVDVEYIKSYTDISLGDFSPKRGTASTLVTVLGSGFLRPVETRLTEVDSLAKSRRLIGTRVLLGGEDVNSYNYNEEGLISLEDPNLSQPIFSIEEGQLRLSEDCSAVVLVDQGEGYFTIYKDLKTGDYRLSDGLDEYVLEVAGSKVVARLRGKEYPVDLGLKTLKLGDRTLYIRTPYESSQGRITGKRVRVLTSGELSFSVPPKKRDGFYDLTLVNPDTERDSKTGDQGFYYLSRPDYNPRILSVDPDQGSVGGGYPIEIRAQESSDGIFRGFVDNGRDQKTAVFLGAVEVEPGDISVSPDGYSLVVRVPAYRGNLEGETDLGRRSVNLVVVNPDGGSDSLEDGFTYVVPSSQPRLTNIFLKEGPAAGGPVVVLEGSGFRLFESFVDLNENAEWEEGEDFQDLNRNGVFDDLRTGRVWLGDYDPATGNYDQNLREVDLEDLTEEEWDRFVLPILPRVYFGRQEARLTVFDQGRLELILPPGLEGTVGVYLVNNDYGRSNELSFDYRSSSPSITRVVPPVANRQGGQEIQILGQDFIESEIDLIVDENRKTKKTIQLVEFGSLEDPMISNQKFKLGQEDQDGFDNSGKVEYRQAEVRLGQLRVYYDARKSQAKTLKFVLEEGEGADKKTYSFTYGDWQEEPIFLPLGLLTRQEARKLENYQGLDYLKVSLEKLEGAEATRRLRVDRGFAPEARLEGPGNLILTCPGFYTIGQTELRLINPDGQEARADFEFARPAKDPKIIKVTSNGQEGQEVQGLDYKVLKYSYRGGNRIRLEGENLARPVRLTLGGRIDIDQDLIQYEPEASKEPRALSFIMPEVDQAYLGQDLALTLVNPDGGSTSHRETRLRAIRPESVNLKIISLVPDQGPSKGGTEVTINGEDFRETMEDYPGRRLKVFFERGGRLVELPREDLLDIQSDTIVLRTPAFPPGPVNVVVENPDGNSVRLIEGFTYTSDPHISAIVDPDYEDRPIDNISVEGGDMVKIKGRDFLEGLRLIFNPRLTELKEDQDLSDFPLGEGESEEIVVIKGRRYLLNFYGHQEVGEGDPDQEGPYLTYIDSGNLLVRTPRGEMGQKGVLVINPDGGTSTVYDLAYGRPEIGSPIGVEAELVYDEFIRISWQGVTQAHEYEIYVSRDREAYEYVGSTRFEHYAYERIEPRTRYRFLIRALGEYGSSKPLAESESNSVRTGSKAGPGDLDGPLGQETSISRQGKTGQVILGSGDYPRGGYRLDLTRGELLGVEDLTVRIPGSLIRELGVGPLVIIGPDYSLTCPLGVFRTDRLGTSEDSGLEFRIRPYRGQVKPGARLVAGPAYSLEARAYEGRAAYEVDRLAGGMDLVFARGNRPSFLGDFGLSRYYGGQWIKTVKVDRMAIYAVTGRRK